MRYIGELLPVLIVALVVVIGYLKKVAIFSTFVVGAKKGISTTVSILPTLIGIVTGITMLSASGALDALVNISKPLFTKLNFPSELLPLAILRPISGSGAKAAVINIFENHHPDSFIGMVSSVLSSSTETTFYAISVYLAGKTYKSLSYTIPIALFGDFLAVVLSVFVVRIMYTSPI